MSKRRADITKGKRAYKADTVWLLAGCVLVFAGLMWFLSTAMVLVDGALVAVDLNNYRPARFTVEEVVYGRSSRGRDYYYAKGRIDGQFEEEFALFGVAPVLPTREALEKHFGQQPVSFAVMYNPNRTAGRLNGQSLRVRPASEGFVESYRSKGMWAIFVVVILFAIVLSAMPFTAPFWQRIDDWRKRT